MRLSDYLKSNFYDANELCSLIKVEPEQLQQWQENSIFPNASYSIDNLIKCSSYLGLYECVEVTDYYPRGALDWGHMLLRHEVEHSSHAYELFQNKYITTLKACADKGIVSEDDKFGDDLIEHIQQVWQQFLCSKYGVISQNGTVEEVVFIDLGRALVDRITEDRTCITVPAEQRALLHEALKLLNRSLSHNAAHERQDSLRYKYIDSVMQKYDLSTC
ncbi:DUF6058 family natural product biosynthesis protein [Pseudoalteromonas luteoviolacea]|uniref:DUF6058 family natural product biosynthesis protein n=1 Tax=Pseudoalteromonas luteoviolacea TaxID=43657 RepID=UPI001F161BDE|nr:DUF6058 family natural product biosynthesis protein [Pseudoalteromonas luteoviolacea]MCF6439632.1 DUF6058 family natural product biosynthesis protein [Pseudoalteromonas luteoviolacea]